MKTLFTFLLALCFGAGYAQEIVQLTNKGMVPETNSDFNPRFLTPFKDKVIFTAKASKNFGSQLFVNDGSISGTKQIAPSWITAYNNPAFVYFKGAMYFSAQDSIHGYELRKFDGDTVTLLKDIAEGKTSSQPVNGTKIRYLEFKDHLYFITTHQNGGKLWRTDGTTEGTTEFFSDPLDTGYQKIELVRADEFMLFTTGDTTVKLWKTDGTKSGTELVTTLPSYSRGIYSYKNEVYFAYYRQSGSVFAKVNLAGAITILAQPVMSNDVLYTVLKGELFIEFIDNGALKVELWKSIGSPETTSLVKSFSSTAIPSWPPAWNYFLGSTESEVILKYTPWWYPDQLWSSDGTTAGTNIICSLYGAQYKIHHDTLYIIGARDNQPEFDSQTVYYYDGLGLSELASLPSDSLQSNECSSIAYNDHALFFNGIFKNGGTRELYKVQVGNVSVSERENPSRISTYPNPLLIGGQVNIHSYNHPSSIQVYDLVGKLVLNKSFGENGLQDGTISLTSAELKNAPGEYFFILNGKGRIDHGRFTLTR